MTRKLGTTTCKGCGQQVDVIYPYSNSDTAIGLSDHEVPAEQRPPWARAEEMVRCEHAGLTIWSREIGWLGHYAPAEITWGSEGLRQGDAA